MSRVRLQYQQQICWTALSDSDQNSVHIFSLIYRWGVTHTQEVARVFVSHIFSKNKTMWSIARAMFPALTNQKPKIPMTDGQKSDL